MHLPPVLFQPISPDDVAATVVADPDARYSGARVEERTLLPGPGAHLAPTRFQDWVDVAAVTGRIAQPTTGYS